jgi:hypothetical protein
MQAFKDSTMDSIMDNGKWKIDNVSIPKNELLTNIAIQQYKFQHFNNPTNPQYLSSPYL